MSLLSLPIIDWGEWGCSSTRCPSSRLPGPSLKLIHMGIHAGWSSSQLEEVCTSTELGYTGISIWEGNFPPWVPRISKIKQDSPLKGIHFFLSLPYPWKNFCFSINILLTLFLANECPNFLRTESTHSFPAQSYPTVKLTCWTHPGVCACTKPLQSCLTLWNPMDCSLPGSSAHGILQARILEWVAMPSSRRLFWPRDRTRHVSYISCIGRWALYH